jgi:adenosylhomocysteine nucleosidase
MSGAEPPVVVVTALAEELAPILRDLAVSVDWLDGRRVLHARAKRTALVLAVTGAGPRNAARHAARLCEAYRPAALIGVGVAGALTASLEPLDLVASARLRNGSGDAPPADPLLLSRAAAVGALKGTLVTTPAPVVSVSDKRALATSLESGSAAAVDMESASWARAAAGAGVPFVIVRAISDGVDEELPDYLPECVGPDGGIRRIAVLRRALARPSSIGALMKMRRRIADCGERLAAFLLDRFLPS